MVHSRSTAAAFFCLAVALAPAGSRAQTAPTPTNDAPNPYQTIEGWAKLPEGRTWGSTSAVDIDKDGVSIWVAERCQTNSCLNSNLDPIMKFDRDGKLLKSFGAGMFSFPHGIHVDRDGNIWVTDGNDNYTRRPQGTPEPEKKMGHNVYKFSPDGKLLLTLGKPGGGRDSEYFWQPNDVLVAPNGNVFVAEGHSSNATANARILIFDKNGKYLKEFGKKGTGQGEYDQPHALAMDSRGRLFIGDRSNNRIVITDQDGKFIDEWYQFSRPSGVWIDQNDVLYVADSESGSVNPPHAAWKRGIRIGSAKDGTLTGFIPDPEADPRSKGLSTSSAEGVAVDKNGVIYGAEVGQKAIKRYLKR